MIKHYVAITGGTDTEQTKSIATLSYAISAITQAVNAQVTTSVPHGMSVGDQVTFFGILGMTQMNSSQAGYETGTVKRVASVIDANNFTLDIDSTGFTAYTSGGSAYLNGIKRINAGEVTSANHGLQNGQKIYITGTTGSTQVNNSFYLVSDATTNCFRIKDLNGSYLNWAAISPYTSGGTITLYNRVITAVTNASPCQVTIPNHGLSTGNKVYINDVGGTTELNELGYVITVVDTNNITLDGVDSSAFGTFTSGGTIRQAYTTFNNCISALNTNVNDGVVAEKTPAPTQITIANLTWARNSNSVATSASLVGQITQGDYISRSATPANGNDEMMYRVLSVTTTTILLESKYLGTNGTDTASVYKVAPNTSCIGANLSTGINISKTLSVSGGYNFSNQTRDGQSIYKHNGARTTSSNVGISMGASDLEYINFVEAYYCLNHSSGTVRNCSFVGGYAYTVYSSTSSPNFDFETVRIGANSVTSWPAWFLSTMLQSITDVKVLSFNANSAQAVALGSGFVYDFDNELEIKCSGYGVYVGTSNVVVKNVISEENYINVHFPSSQSNRYVLDSKLNDGSYGVYAGTLGSQSVVRGCEIKRNTIRGIEMSQFSGLVFEDNDFEDNARDFYMDQYSGGAVSINNRHATPSLYSYDRAYNAGSLSIIKASIDAPSLAKAFNIPVGDYMIMPQYNLQDSFGISGRIYGRGSVVRDTSTLLPNGNYSTKIALTSTVINNYFDWEVDAIFVKSGVAQSIEYVVQANGVWVGTITPKLKLNGVTIKTGTPITSISNGSFDTKTISVTSGEVTEDGILTLEFECNMNTITINTGIITVT